MVTLTVTHPLTMSLHIGVELPEELRVKKKKNRACGDDIGSS